MLRAYLDNAATTRLHPEVRDAMDSVEEFGNPSSLHRLGRAARKRLDEARQEAAAALKVEPDTIFFTSGATEANNLAIFGVAGLPDSRDASFVTTRVEHSSVLAPIRELEKRGQPVRWVDCDEFGSVSAAAVEAALTDDTAFVSVMFANNEVGTRQPVGEIAAVVARQGGLYHSDAAQACGKERLRPRDLAVDLMTLSGHKMHGPRGVGALYVRRGLALAPHLVGGGHERGLRAGTENLTGAVGFARALSVAERDLETNRQHMEALREQLRQSLQDLPEIQFQGHADERLPSILCFSFPDLDGDALLVQLDMQGVCVSSGSACESRSQDPSHVLRAMGVPDARTQGTLRFAVAADTTPDEIVVAVNALRLAVQRLRR